MRRIVLAGSPRLQDLNVLVCESEYVLAMDVSERVATMGATVVGRASTPEEAAALVRKHRADVDMAIVARHLGDRVAQSIVDRLETLGVPAIIYSDTPAGEQWTV